MISSVSRRSRHISRFLAPTLLSAAFVFLVGSNSSVLGQLFAPEGATAPTFNAVPASLGVIPDHVGTCQVGPFSSIREVSFNVVGLDGPPADIQLSMTFGSPNHTFMGDIDARLISPNGLQRIIFSRTGATTTTGGGDNSDLGATYVFRDNAVPPNGGWWQTANLLGSGTVMTAGAYRTTDAGGDGEPNPQPATSLSTAFATVSNPNGSWILRLTDRCGGDTGGIIAAALTIAVTPTRSRADFDGDGRSDMSVFRPSDGNWYLNKSAEGFAAIAWGLATDIPAPGDFDGDGKEDVVIYRPSTGTWWQLFSGGGFTNVKFGIAGDIPVTGDYNGDGLTDIAVFRPSNNFWYIRYTGSGTLIFSQFGSGGDKVVPGDYDGDGTTDQAVFRPSNGSWWIRNTSTGVLRALVFGNSTDKPVPGDYDGDNKIDVAIWRPSNGQWWMVYSTTGAVNTVTFGTAGDEPVPGDYDGDERDDQAIYRDGVWWINRSTAGVAAFQFGIANDVPIPGKYIPE